MNNQSLDWSAFWPHPDLLFSFQSTEAVTTHFIFAILAVLGLFLLWEAYLAIRYSHRIGFYKNNLKGITPETLLSKRNALCEEEKKRLESRKFYSSITQSLWGEFDESLNEYQGKLYNNIEAEQFFNEESLAGRITKSRLFPTGAAVLTGLGVLGTFLGLQLGLSGLNLAGDISQIQGEIRLLAQSASVAFVTSVWGVSSSLLLNVFEKSICGHILRKISQLQSQIDQLFPRFPVVNIFTNLLDTTKESKTIQSVLAEQIGDRMQTSLDSFSQNMSQSLGDNIAQAAQDISSAIGGTLKSTIEESLVPAVQSMAHVSEELANKQAKGSEDAMTALLERFLSEVGKEGQNQREALHSAAQEMEKTMGHMSESMQHVFSSFEEQQNKFNVEQDQRSATLQGIVDSMLKKQDEAQTKTTEKLSQSLEGFINHVGTAQTQQTASLDTVSEGVREAVSGLGDQVHDFMESLSQAQSHMMEVQDQRQKVLERQIEEIIEKQTFALQYMENSVGTHVDATKRVLSQSEELQNHVSESTNAMKNMINKINSTGEQFTSASANLRAFGTAVTDSIQKVTQANSESISLAEKLIHQNTDVTSNLETMLISLEDMHKSVEAASTQIKEAVNGSRDGFSTIAEQYEDIEENLENYTTTLKNQIEKLLNDYGDLVKGQTEERMRTWTNETSSFCKSMTSVVQAIGEVVDDIENKKPSRY